MKYLHICNNEKFIFPFIEFIHENFDESEHFFIVIKNKDYVINESSNVKVIQDVRNNILYLKNKIKEFDKIFFHSLINEHLVYFLFLHPQYLKKSYWIIWGADLYRYLNRTKTFKNYIKYLILRTIIGKVSGLITHIKGDFELAKKWYGAKGKHYYCFMYPSNLYKEYVVCRNIVYDKLVIQIGNSADPSNNHIDIMRKLEKYRDENIEIICPLSYGKKYYSEEIILVGKDMFGEKFIPLTDFLPSNEYLDLLARVDVAIFNHRRQQGIGNIITLIGLGKKVYIREDITTWDFCIDHDLKVFSMNDDYEDLFEEMVESVKIKNIENVRRQFSEEKLVNDLKSLFNEG